MVANADLIIFLDTPYDVRTFRIMKRYIYQVFGMEKSNYKPSFAIFKKMFSWNKYFEEVSKKEILQILSIYSHKVLIWEKNNISIDDILQHLKTD